MPLQDPSSPLLSLSLPTLLIFECVLVYMSSDESSALIQWFVDYFSSGDGALGGIVYEMFGLGDSFGKVMLDNLKVRLFPMGYSTYRPDCLHCPDISSTEHPVSQCFSSRC
jgi:[phosphatase 2A protein]-leucine-carboxy methyltransferase